MMISSRGRYCLRVMTDLAEHRDDGYVPMKDVAARQEISLKYLQGKTGGYRLTRTPEEYTLGEILRLTEGTLAPVACLDCGTAPCDRAERCKTLPVWTELDRIINSYLDSVTIAVLMQE